MKYPFYQGDGRQPQRETSAQLPVFQGSRLQRPEHYIADRGLRDACNVALILGQPLLLTGEPGTGKTQFAYSLAWELGFGPPLKFETKSNSVARDLFYTYDALRRFQDAQASPGLGESGQGGRQAEGQTKTALDYMTFQALGVAILLTLTPGEIQSVLPPEVSHDCKQRSVVLIDEIDKAPRDFANDLLNELEQDMYFRIPELGNRMIRADQDLKPIVIITSNSEKDLPDAFLRRCIYYDIPFPESERLGEIVANRLSLPGGYGNSLVQMALDLFYRLRSPQSGLRKKPATAELLGWLLTLQAIYPNLENPLAMANLQVIYQTLSSLIKTAEDQQLAVKVVDQWIQEQNQKPN